MNQPEPPAVSIPAGFPKIVGVMGGGSAGESSLNTARELGERIAREGWVLLNGGRNKGVMHASAQGAREAGGLVIGILPDDHPGQVSPYVTIPILTGMGSARNNINVLSSHVVVACPGGAGTVSEIALALKAGRPVILMDFDLGRVFEREENAGLLKRAATPQTAIEMIRAL